MRTRKSNAPPLARKVSPRTVNREVGTINNMLNKGVMWPLIGRNAIAGLKPLKHTTPVKQRRPLNSDEIGRLLAESRDYLKPVWRMLFCTGVRLERACGPAVFGHRLCGACSS